jgi:predicted NBD/HSP70 family sugar kinase
MPDDDRARASTSRHGAEQLPSVTVDTYNAELRDADGFLGDRASKRAFIALLDDWRDRLRRLGTDPLGKTPTKQIKKKKLDKLLLEGDPEAAGLIHSAIEEFAQELAGVIRRFLRLKTWRDTERIVIGGGLRASRIGELAIGRTSVLLKSEGQDIGISPIRHHPDEAGLIGCAHLAPPWMFSGHDGILAVDIGGSNIRAGVVELNLKKSDDLAAAHVMAFDLWEHANDAPSRDEAVERLGAMLRDLARRAEKDGFALAPFIGIGCPGIIRDDGSIERGGQNLPGNWESQKFHLPTQLLELVPEIGGHQTMIVMHNDAVVQGLSQIPWMTDVAHWGVLTIGTGLGNARFSFPKKDKTAAKGGGGAKAKRRPSAKKQE